jgi:heat shock protein HtpX
MSLWAAVGAVVGGVVGFLSASVVGLVIGTTVVGAGGAVVAVGLVGRFVDSALSNVVAGIRARELDVDGAPRLVNLLRGLCATAGVSVPRVSITDDPSINAFIAADPAGEARAEVVVTRGFVDALERIEMEGAVAVCLARLRSGLAEAQTLAVALVSGGPWFIPGPARRKVVAAALSERAIFDADVKGVAVTRYPPGLAAALQRMIDTSTRVAGAGAEANLLWLADPAGESVNDLGSARSGSRVESSGDRPHGVRRPPLTERLALLREI